MSSKFPPYLKFDAKPSADALAVVLGPDFASSGVSFVETEHEIIMAPPHIPLRAIIVFNLLFSAVISAAPWVLPRFGIAMPSNITPTGIWIATGALWLLINPTFLGVMYWWHRTTQKIGPGAIVDKHSRELHLPWLDVTVPENQIHYFVEMNGRHRYGGQNAQVGQYSVLFEDDQDVLFLAPIARLNTKILGKSKLKELADFYGVRMRQVRL
ncbi:MAG: hypothetical protein GY747_12945 [Planctomycetes bacterium]|nr:hypothetical protein [Planctomycetota bacterium]MCP4771994.1 hypothetical protein [Planctomycetota bacterium]MCP4860266.1 hypothetical protein [Planctomycetota bacterium]